MPSALSRRLPLALVLALALASGPAGCSSDDDSRSGAGQPGQTERDVVRALSHELERRASAVRHADAGAFAAGLGGSTAFRAQQQTWFANMTQLPLGRFGYTLDPAQLVREGDGYRAVVEARLQLQGYDAEPVVSSDRYRFEPRPHHPTRLRLVSVSDPAWEADHGVRSQPWETGLIDVRESGGVLGIFDAESAEESTTLLESVRSGITAVSAEVPYTWSRSVVVYALSDPAFLDGLEGVPGDDPGDLDAVAVPVPTAPGSDEQAATRIVLNPRMLERSGRERDRLIRHELTHVAIGARADGAPVWLSEGLAEYVSVRPLAPEEQRIPEAAVVAADEGDDDLPADDTFNDGDSQAHYGLSWWAVEYVAEAYGADAPWQLLDAMGAPGADPAAVLRDRLGTTTQQLARQADRLILALYEPGADIT